MPELRSFPVGRYVVFYLPMPDGIELCVSCMGLAI